MSLYETIVRLYPADVRYAYGQEMRDAFVARDAERRARGLCRAVIGRIRDTSALLVDVAVERVSSLYSHRSFHGPRHVDLGVVRPPNVSKSDWFGADPRS